MGGREARGKGEERRGEGKREREREREGGGRELVYLHVYRAASGPHRINWCPLSMDVVGMVWSIGVNLPTLKKPKESNFPSQSSLCGWP